MRQSHRAPGIPAAHRRAEQGGTGVAPQSRRGQYAGGARGSGGNGSRRSLRRSAPFPRSITTYEREHEYNLWFVVTARDRAVVDRVLADIAAATGLTPLDLPMLEDYFIDLGFALKWS